MPSSPSDRVTSQVDKGEIRDVILQASVSPLLLSLVTFSSMCQEDANRHTTPIGQLSRALCQPGDAWPTFLPGLFNISIREGQWRFLYPVNQPAIKPQGLPIALLYHCFSYYPTCSPVFHLCKGKTNICEGNWTLGDGNAHCGGIVRADWCFVFHLVAHDGAHKLQGRWHKQSQEASNSLMLW